MSAPYGGMYGPSAPGGGYMAPGRMVGGAPVGGAYGQPYAMNYAPPSLGGSMGGQYKPGVMIPPPGQQMGQGGPWSPHSPMMPTPQQQIQQMQQQQQQQQGGGALSNVLTPEMREKMEDPLSIYETTKERELNDTMSDLYAAMKTLEYLEKIYAGGHLQYHEYNKQCVVLIQQIRHIMEPLHSNVQQLVTMFKNMGISFERAGARMTAGKPAEAPKSAGNFAKMASDITARMLTLIDYIELDYKSVNDLGVKVRELEAALIEAKEYLPKDFTFTSVIGKWVKRFNEWGPTYVLLDDQINEFKYDLQTGMTDFQKVL